MRLHEAAADGEAQARARAPVVPGAQAVVRLEDAPSLGLGHAVAVIDDGDAQQLAVARGVQAERVVGVGAAGVLEQVHEHLADHRLVDAHGRQLGRAVDVDDLAVERRGGIVDRGVEQLVDRHDRAPRLQHAGLDAREVEHVGDQPHEPIGLVLDSADQRLALVLGHVLAQGRGGRGDRRERRAQIVRDRLQQRGAQAVGLLERLQQQRFVLQPRPPESEPEDAAERLEHRLGLLLDRALPGVDGQQPERDAAVGDRERQPPALTAEAAHLGRLLRRERLLEPRRGVAVADALVELLVAHRHP